MREAAQAGPVLGLETGGAQASLALLADGRLLGSRAATRRAHGESLASQVAELLAECGLNLRDLAAIAVGIGPGSFTGLRISLSYAKGIASAGVCGVVGVSSLDAVALCAATHANLPSQTTICPMFDARKGEVYTAIYRLGNEGLERRSEDMVTRPAALTSLLAGRVFFVGDGAATYARELEGAAPEGVIGALPQERTAAEMVAVLGAVRVAHNQLDNIRGLEPRYLRPPEAVLKARAAEARAGLEGIWSSGKKFSFANTPTTTKN